MNFNNELTPVRCITTGDSKAITVEATVGKLMGGLKQWPWPLRMGTKLGLAVWRDITIALQNHEKPILYNHITTVCFLNLPSALIARKNHDTQL